MYYSEVRSAADLATQLATHGRAVVSLDLMRYDAEALPWVLASHSTVNEQAVYRIEFEEDDNRLVVTLVDVEPEPDPDQRDEPLRPSMRNPDSAVRTYLEDLNERCYEKMHLDLLRDPDEAAEQ